jgi:mono/diheme cytochrome c family protein
MVLLLVPLVLLVGAGCRGHTSAADALGSDIAAKMRSAALKNGVRGRVALAGARLFGESGCANCHVYGGVGSTNLGAPELTAEGSKGKSAAELVAFLRCPQCSDSQSSMPPFKALGERNLRKLAIFLEASKGGG